MNKIIQKENNIPASWNTSKTVLVQKKKPTVKDLRPVALTNATYKLFMGIVKTKLNIKEESEVHAGLTKIEESRTTY